MARIKPPICLVCKEPVNVGEPYKMVAIEWVKFPDEERIGVAANFRFHVPCFEKSTPKSREKLIKAHFSENL